MIYVIQMGLAGPIKIGFSENVGRRVETLQTISPFELHLLVAFEGTVEDEAALHRRFAKHRMRGEWFLPAAEIFEFCRERDPIHRSRVNRLESKWDEALADGITRDEQYQLVGPTGGEGS